MSLASPPKVLITGASGFVGQRLTAALEARHPDWVLDGPAADGPGAIDVTDPVAVDTWIRQGRPDVVVHMAAVAAVTASHENPRLAWRVNLDGTLNVVLALQQYAPDARLLFVSSSEIYGESLNCGHAVDEQALLRPVNPYAASKAAADILVRQAAAMGVKATVMRPFNHTGPGQGTAFVIPSFADQIALIEAGRQAPLLEVGDLDAERDFLDVEDVIDAYLLMLERDDLASGEVFNVASGVSVRIGDILEQLLGLARVRIEVRVDPTRLRPTRVPRVVGDAARLRSLGWAPKRRLADTAAAILEDRRRIAGLG
jgi:GDP-4-dehydro-6-deoxy-D-mannose reductase